MLLSSLVLISLFTQVSSGVGEEVFQGVTYKVVSAQAAQIEIIWKDEKGELLRTFPRVSTMLEGEGIEAVMNGGIFESGEIPTGLLIQNKEELVPLNLKSGKGNFYLKPNGVFYLTENGAFICDAEKFSNDGKKVTSATQSGPLLLKEREIHKAFKKGSSSRLLRNGVGVKSDGSVILAISDQFSKKQPNLYEFAEFFKSKGCTSALYLDGVISELRDETTRAKPSRRFSSFVVVLRP